MELGNIELGTHRVKVASTNESRRLWFSPKRYFGHFLLLVMIRQREGELTPIEVWRGQSLGEDLTVQGAVMSRQGEEVAKGREP
ncbi:MAG: hypothetical protein K0M60_03535 [Hydrogenophaga sp.]|nr:hypothetical protein [Hydrogenophaga sp.]